MKLDELDWRAKPTLFICNPHFLVVRVVDIIVGYGGSKKHALVSRNSLADLKAARFIGKELLARLLAIV